jgi:hypothetical protein
VVVMAALGSYTRSGAQHYIYVSGAQAASAVAQTLEREGWETSVRDDGETWLVSANCLRVLTGPLVGETRARLEALAAAHDGEYDGCD